MQKTLHDFQNSAGIPVGEQILLLENPKLLDGYFPCFGSYDLPAQPSLPQRALRFLGRKLGREIILPKSPVENLYAGYIHRSFENEALLNRLYDRIAECSDRKFNLLIGKSDYHFDAKAAAALPDNVLSVLANNVDVVDPRVRALPMGRDFRSATLFADQKPQSQKTNLVYCNFSTNTHAVRKEVHELLREKDFVLFEHMGQFRSYSKSREEFFDELGASKFCICPRGNAIDTFRMWDSMYMGTIPIVVKEAVFHDQIEDLPILFLDSYADFGELTAQFLEDKYSEMLSRNYSYEKLTLPFWMRNSNSHE